MDATFEVAFAKLWLGFYPALPVSEASMAAYAETLGDLASDAIAAAMHELALTSVRMPSVADIRRVVVDHAQAQRSAPRMPRWIDGERTYDCGYCLDRPSRWVSVVHPALLDWFRETFDDELYPDNWCEWLRASDRLRAQENRRRFGVRYTPRLETRLCRCAYPMQTHVAFQPSKGGAVTYALFDPARDCPSGAPIHESVARFLGATVVPAKKVAL